MTEPILSVATILAFLWLLCVIYYEMFLRKHSTIHIKATATVRIIEDEDKPAEDKPEDAGESEMGSPPVDEAAGPRPFAVTNSRGKTYYLHAKRVTLRNNANPVIHYFASTIKDGVLFAMPDGYGLAEGRNGLPCLRKLEPGDECQAEG